MSTQSRYDSERNIWIVDQASDAYGMLNMGKPIVLSPIHPRTLCEGHHCIVHNPSEHHMREWPICWRADKCIAERICEHGVGHPDPDDAAFQIRIGKSHLTVHGCDGCCS